MIHCQNGPQRTQNAFNGILIKSGVLLVQIWYFNTMSIETKNHGNCSVSLIILLYHMSFFYLHSFLILFAITYQSSYFDIELTLVVLFLLNFHISILLELGLSLAHLCLPIYFKSFQIWTLNDQAFIPRSNLRLLQMSAFTVLLYPQLKKEFL